MSRSEHLFCLFLSRSKALQLLGFGVLVFPTIFYLFLSFCNFGQQLGNNFCDQKAVFWGSDPRPDRDVSSGWIITSEYHTDVCCMIVIIRNTENEKIPSSCI